jgi:hypothetical protein
MTGTMSLATIKFPEDWPPQCPPADAEPTAHTVYATCRRNPPATDDFRTAFERDYKPEGDGCIRRGLSVSLAVEDARWICTQFKRLHKFIVVGQLSPEHGKIKKTDGPVASHHTFWKHSNVSFHKLFTVVMQ